MKWKVEKVGEEFEVYQGKHRKRIFPSKDTALRWARQKMAKDDTLVTVEDDGYQTKD